MYSYNLTLSKLRQELEVAIPDCQQLPSLTSLEQLPYLISYSISIDYWRMKLIFIHSAIISEGLRLSYGVSTRSQRVSPHEPLFFKSNIKPTTTSSSRQNENCSESKDWIIPPGTPVGMTAVLIHHNEGLFPNSNAFIPERWLDKNGHRRRDLEGYLLSFSKGSPQCLGIK